MQVIPTRKPENSIVRRVEKILFPRLDYSRRRREMKVFVATLLSGLIAAGILSAVIIFESSRTKW